jgi:macrolide-specific efflux system membrane fusion protein
MTSSSTHPRPWLRPLALALLITALGAAGWYAWKTWGGGAPKPDEYVFASVQRGDIEDLVSATGALQPRDYVDVGAQVSGQVKKILVEVGSEVKEGDLLAEIDAEQSAARVDANRAQLRAQQATLIEREVSLAKAERDLQRQKNLLAEEATTIELVQNAETTLKTARTQLNSLKAQIDQVQASMRVEEANLKYTKIYAPMAGTIVSITARQGQTLNTNQSAPTVLRIADLSTMTVQTQVSEADVSKLRGGMQSYFTTLGSQGRRWYGQLRKVEPTPTVTNNVVLYNALFDVPNPNKSLMTQMTAQVFFVAAEARDVLMVPMSAVTIQRSASGAGGSGRRERWGAASGPAPAASAAPGAAMQVPAASAPNIQATSAEANASAPAAGRERPRFDREAWANMSEDDRQRMRSERQAARAASGARGTADAARDARPRDASRSAAPNANASAPAADRPRMAAGSGMASGNAPRGPRRATVKVATADGSIQEREVMVGISNRVHAEILSGLQEGERVVAGVKVPDAPKRNTAQNQGANALGQGPGGIPGAAGGGGNRR